LLSAQADDLDWFARELSRLPFDFKILTPAAMRESLRRCANRLRRLGKDT
jgi:predicted DNA-binding transcriptional regulator YafY